MTMLAVRELSKSYPGFTLDRVTFSVEKGYIMGFIGRNGAGKTTTLKAMLGLVHPDGGVVEVFGQPLMGNELRCRQRIGVVLGECPYPGKRLREIADVTGRFYESWDESLFQQYLRRFDLDPHVDFVKIIIILTGRAHRPDKTGEAAEDFFLF